MTEFGPGFSDKWLRRLFYVLLILLIVAILGITYRLVEFIILRRDTKQHAITSVTAIVAKAEASQEEIILPGNVLAWHEATIYARTNGYLINWYTDIGARVKAGDLLAEISTPEVNSQLRQTEAQ